MSYYDDLVTKFYLEEELALMARPAEIQKDIALISQAYHRAIKNKKPADADLANRIIEDLKQELENVKRAIKNNSREVLPSQPSGDKRIFILER